MKQAIAGVSPPSLEEAKIMEVWPTIAATPAGRFVGRMCSLGGKSPLAIGKLLCIFPGIPLALALFAISLAPPIPFAGLFNRRYKLTNRRVIEVQDRLTWRIARPLGIPIPCPTIQFNVATRWVDLDRFDAIDVEVLPGQEWFPAGELIFKLGKTETLRLSGVSRPDTFAQTCLKAQRAYVGVRKVSKV